MSTFVDHHHDTNNKMASTGKFLPQQQTIGMDHNNGNSNNNKSAAPQSTTTGSSSNTVCFCCDREPLEYLDYDYTYDDTTAGKRKPQPYPRIRERGEFYIDTFNDQPWACTFGTWEHVRMQASDYICQSQNHCCSPSQVKLTLVYSTLLVLPLSRLLLFCCSLFHCLPLN
jgi:hypothetical protein